MYLTALSNLSAFLSHLSRRKTYQKKMSKRIRAHSERKILFYPAPCFLQFIHILQLETKGSIFTM